MKAAVVACAEQGTRTRKLGALTGKNAGIKKGRRKKWNKDMTWEW